MIRSRSFSVLYSPAAALPARFRVKTHFGLVNEAVVDVIGPDFTIVSSDEVLSDYASAEDQLRQLLFSREPMAAVAVERNRLYFARDWLGLKSLVRETMPDGATHFGTLAMTNESQEVPFGRLWCLDLDSGEILAMTSPFSYVSSIPAGAADLDLLTDQLINLLAQRMVSRLSGQKVLPILFSGGVDSVLLAEICRRHLSLEKICLINVGFGESAAPDQEAAAAALAQMNSGQFWCFHKIKGWEMSDGEKGKLASFCRPNKTILDWSLGRVLFTALGGFGLTECAAEATVVVSGLGADELFGGYARHSSGNLRDNLLGDLSRIGSRNGGRDNRVCLACSNLRLEFPFLAKEVVDFAMQTVPDRFKLWSTGQPTTTINKFIVRNALEKKILADCGNQELF